MTTYHHSVCLPASMRNAMSISGISSVLLSFSATTKLGLKHDKSSLKGLQTFSKSGGFVRPIRAVNLDEAKLKDKGSRHRINAFEVTEVPQVTKADWYAGTVLAIEDVATGIRCIVVETEISRELIERENAYTKPGQVAQVKLKGGDSLKVPVSSPPFGRDTNRLSLYKMRGDVPAGTAKLPNSTLSVKAPLYLHVTQSDFPILYALKQGDEIEVGPFEGIGLDLRPMLFISGFPTLLLFASGRGIAVARSIIEAKEGDAGSVSLGFRDEVRLYYYAPDPTLIAYKGNFGEWEEKGVKIRTAVSSTEGENWDGFVGSFTTLWDEDDIEYDPDTTAAIVCVEDDARNEMIELLSEAGIPEKQVIYWDAPDKL